MPLLLALAIVTWHKRVKGCTNTEALRFNGKYTRVCCWTCGDHLWQRRGLFTGKAR